MRKTICLIWVRILLIKMRKICWTYALIEWQGNEIYHLGNKEVEATKAKRRHMEGNIVGTDTLQREKNGSVTSK
ncbi:hypothetical protein H5410_062723 [Solanum commersonii]|uniref:Late blight resistance protein n=1 Tax=Solanum commersonii TaxID=4109 RepID=A0A9J5WBQ9_SOLCO|nr:hypothetical protein H5410_062723 [Solanum commersonii]